MSRRRFRQHVVVEPEREIRDYRHLPAPIRIEDTRAFQDVVVPQDEGDDEFRQLAWLVRTIGF